MFTRWFGLSLQVAVGSRAFEGSHSLVVSLSEHHWTCHGELGISIWDVYQITGLPIVREMYNEFFPTNKIILDKISLHPFGICSTFGCIYTGVSRPKFTEWVKEFIGSTFTTCRLRIFVPRWRISKIGDKTATPI